MVRLILGCGISTTILGFRWLGSRIGAIVNADGEWIR
jgi:hypothetical protein